MNAFPHGGHVLDLARRAGCKVEELLDFSANINPLGPPEALRPVVSRHLETITHYPDPDCRALREAIAETFALLPEQVVCGNGSTELLYALPLAFPLTKAVIPVPSYLDYATAARRAGLAVATLALDARRGFAVDWGQVARALDGVDGGGAMVMVGQPGNPAGTLFDPDELLAVADRYPGTLFVVDEAFADFISDYRTLVCYGRPNILVLRSMTKFYAMPGLRLGYALAPVPLARQLSAFLPPWSVGSLAQAVGIAVLQDKAYAQETRAAVSRLREQLHRGLAGLEGVTVFPSAANYLLVRLETPHPNAPALAQALLAQGIAIRVCDNYQGLDQDETAQRYFRVAVRAEHENERLLDALARILADHKGIGRTPAAPERPRARPKRKTPAIMFQGTTSNAGKSVLAAAFCRILLQDGYRVAPFKAQNMSLNSYVTRDGGEMGRAQVVQAQACRLEPDARMNPVLLKPSSDTGAQVIVLGQPVGNMDVDAYIKYKPTAFQAARAAYDALAAEADVMVLEGAGSPGEVNLKQHDIVNMTMARHAGAKVLLVGDIDRGGVFSAFVGTLEVLAEWERALVTGFVINRFRGKQALLSDAVDYLQAHTGRPTFGVIPYLHDLGLPEEDSVSFKAMERERAPKEADGVEIALIDLPHISNFTDFDALALEPDVHLRIVRDARQLGSPDAVILPGSKNVPGDLAWLRATGLADGVVGLAEKGAVIVGVCGGLQMLGETIADPYGIESGKRESSQPGLGLLPLGTVLEQDKTLKLVWANHPESGCRLKGYEIHHGRTEGEDISVAMVTDEGKPIGFATQDGRISGTYLHGLYDNDAFRRWFIDTLRARRGLSPRGGVQVHYDVEAALDRLADAVRENLDVAGIYRRLSL